MNANNPRKVFAFLQNGRGRYVVGSVLSSLLCNIFLHQLDEYMIGLEANEAQTKKEANLRRSATYRKVDNAIFRARRKLRGNLDRQARRELLATLGSFR